MYFLLAWKNVFFKDYLSQEHFVLGVIPRHEGIRRGFHIGVSNFF